MTAPYTMQKTVEIMHSIYANNIDTPAKPNIEPPFIFSFIFEIKPFKLSAISPYMVLNATYLFLAAKLDTIFQKDLFCSSYISYT